MVLIEDIIVKPVIEALSDKVVPCNADEFFKID